MYLLRRLDPWLRRRSFPIMAIGIGLLLVAPSLFTGFATDDHNFRAVFEGAPGAPELQRAPWEVFSFYADRGTEQRKAMLERGAMPWWTGETFHGAFFRPVSSLSHYLDWRLFGEHAWPMHLHSLLVFAGLLGGLALLYRRVHGAGWVAALALLLYAVDDARGLNVGWLSGRNTLLGAFFGVWTIYAHDRWRRDGWRAGMLAAPALWGLALASSEGGLGTAGYLAAYTLFIDRANWRSRFASLIVYAPVFLAWALVYKTHGYGVHGSNGYIDPFSDPVRYLFGALANLPVQLSGQFGPPDCVVYNFFPPPWKYGYWALAALYVGLLTTLLWPVLRANAAARFWALGMILSLLPSAATLPQDRLLPLASVGGAALIALLLERLMSMMQTPHLRRVGFAFYALVTCHLVIAPLVFPITSSALGGIEQANLRANHSLPMDPSMTGDTLVIVNAPSELMCLAVPIVRSSLREPVPAHTLLLTVGNDAVTVARADDHTLLVRTDGDMLNSVWANVFRQTSLEPMRPGWTLSLSNVRIEVIEAGPGGSPTLTRYTFTEPLDSPRIHWMTWGGDLYVPFALPKAGEAMALAARPFLPVAQREFVPVRQLPAGT